MLGLTTTKGAKTTVVRIDLTRPTEEDTVMSSSSRDTSPGETTTGIAGTTIGHTKEDKNMITVIYRAKSAENTTAG